MFHALKRRRHLKASALLQGMMLISTISLALHVGLDTSPGKYGPNSGVGPMFAVIDLGTNQTPICFNNVGSVVLTSSGTYTFWKAGVTGSIALSTVTGLNDSDKMSGLALTTEHSPADTDTTGTTYVTGYAYTCTYGGTVTPLGAFDGLFPGRSASGSYQYESMYPYGIDNAGTVYSICNKIYYVNYPSQPDFGDYISATGTGAIGTYGPVTGLPFIGGYSHLHSYVDGQPTFIPYKVGSSGIVLGWSETGSYTQTIPPGAIIPATVESSYWNGSDIVQTGTATLYSVNSAGEILASSPTGTLTSLNVTVDPKFIPPAAFAGVWNAKHQTVAGASYYDPGLDGTMPVSGNLTDLIYPGSSWSGITAGSFNGSINDNGAIVGTATLTTTVGGTTTSTSHGVMLLPIELDLVNRDDLTKKWTDKVVQSGLGTVYAGTTTGDMVEWKINGGTGWLSGTYTWTATDSNSNVITGPSGVGVDHWQICDTGGNDPASKTTLDWNPDTYKIKCVISFSGGGTIPIEFTQKVGWRTEDYVVIGQIVNSSTFASSGPSTSFESTAFRTAVATDCFAAYSAGSGLASLAGLSPSALPDSAFGFIEFGSWGLWPHSLTPQGPLWYAGAVTEGERYWMLEAALNASVDTPTVSTPLTPAQMLSVQSDGKYRIFHRYQTRFTVTSTGTIDTTSFHDIHNDGITGQTKFDIPAGAFNPAWDNPPIQLFSIDAQTNPIDSVPNQGYTKTSSDLKKHSSYASGRVGSDGQNVNWHVFGQDVPWIYSEIICSVATDHTVTSKIKTSVDKTWLDTGSVSGSTAFNNLNIYKATQDPITGVITYVLQPNGLLSMSGQLQSFILSVPLGTWPTPAPTPSIP